jgi:hypothetical protein
VYDDATRPAYPFLGPLEAAAPGLLAEVKRLDEALWAPAQGYSDGVHVCVFEAGRFLHELDAAAVARARAACPAAAAVVGTIEGVRLAGYQRFVRGAGMAVHTYPRANSMVRRILGLQLRTREQAWWPPGRARLLDTRLPHWARNDDDVVLHGTSRFPLHADWHEIATGMMTTGAGAGRSSVRRESSLQTSIAAEPRGRSALLEVLSQQARKLRELRQRAAERAWRGGCVVRRAAILSR